MGEIFRLVGGRFTRVPGELQQISVGQGSAVWGLTASHGIFRLNVTTGFFEQIAGQLTSISVGSENGSAVWGLSPSSGIFRFNGRAFEQVAGLLKSISVGGFSIWGLNAANEIFVFSVFEGAFQQVPGNLASISVGADGTAWGISASQGIFRSRLGALSFQQVPGNLVSISAGADGTAWGINASQEIFHFDLVTSSFQQVPGNLVSISAGENGSAWGLNAANEIFVFDVGTGVFKQVPGLLTSLVASRDGSVWGINDLPPQPPAPTYSFAVSSFGIDQIRSADTDTLFVSTSLRVLNANGSLHLDLGSKGGPLGDHRAGDTVIPGLVFENVDVPPPTPENPDGGSVYWVFLLVNNGHADSGFVALLNKTADAFAGALAGKLLDGGGGASGEGLFAALTTGILIGQEVLNLLTADCDGQVAASRFPAFTALQLSSMVPNPGQSFDITEDNPGTDSPAGCGENSDYKINYRIQQNVTV
jgi:hypothetical protein